MTLGSPTTTSVSACQEINAKTFLFTPTHQLPFSSASLSDRWVSAGYHRQRGAAEALVRVFEEQGQEDRALAHLVQ